MNIIELFVSSSLSHPITHILLHLILHFIWINEWSTFIYVNIFEIHTQVFIQGDKLGEKVDEFTNIS